MDLSFQKYPGPMIHTSKPTCGYECTFPGYIGTGLYSAFHKDPMEIPVDTDHIVLNGLPYCVNAVSSHEKNFDGILKQHGLKQSLEEMNNGECIGHGLNQADEDHTHNNEEYPCSYDSNSALEFPVLQTVVTTTTKMSCEAYKSTVVKCGDNFYEVKDLLSCPLAENISRNVCSEIKIQEDWGMVKSGLLSEQFLTSNKVDHIESGDAYQDGLAAERTYTGYEGQTFGFENTEY